MTTTNRYVFFVGSTETHKAHSDTHATDIIDQAELSYDIQHARGMWEDTLEDTALIAVNLESDERALMVAHALSVATGNDCVLVSRNGKAGDDSPFKSLRRFFVTWEHATTGNRTISGSGDTRTEGRYVPDIHGNVVAWLVWRDSVTVSPIEGN